MNFLTHNQVWPEVIEADGIIMMGYLTASFSDLRTAFGNPITEPLAPEQDFEWRLRFEDGQVATIYDYWPDRVRPLHWTVREPMQWHVGAARRDVFQRVHDAFRAAMNLKARSAA